MIIGVINRTMMASFVFSHPIGGMELISLAVAENAISPNKPFLVEVSRLIRNYT